MLLINLAICIFCAIQNPKGMSSMFLYIFVGNFFLYLQYYIFMKFFCGEKLECYFLFFLILCIICRFSALYFFKQMEKDSKVSAAESRSLNQDCMLLGFFDQHDIWHFLGGFGLFFTFMFLLTLDDDLLDVSQHKIPVF